MNQNNFGNSLNYTEHLSFACSKCGHQLFAYQTRPEGGALIHVPEPGLTLDRFNKAERVAFAICSKCKGQTMIDIGYFGIE